MSTPAGQVVPPAPQPGMSEDQVKDLVRSFLTNRNLTAEQGTAQLLSDNADLRERNRTLMTRVQALEASAPKEGALVLTGEDVKLFNDLRALLRDGQKPEDLKAVAREHGERGDKIALLERELAVLKIAEAENWKPSVLEKVTKGMDLVLEETEDEIDDPEKEGEKKKVKAAHGFLSTKDDKGVVSKTRLSEELKELLPSLGKDEREGGAEGARTARASGTPFVRQSEGGKADASGKKSVAKNFINKRYATPAKQGADAK